MWPARGCLHHAITAALVNLWSYCLPHVFTSSFPPCPLFPVAFPFSSTLPLPASGLLLCLWASCLGCPGRRSVAHCSFASPVPASLPSPSPAASLRPRLSRFPCCGFFSATVIGFFVALVLWQAGFAGIQVDEASHPGPGSATTDGVSAPLPSSQDRDLVDTVVTVTGHQFPVLEPSSTDASTAQPLVCLAIFVPSQPYLPSRTALPRRPPPLLPCAHLPSP